MNLPPTKMRHEAVQAPLRPLHQEPARASRRRPAAEARRPDHGRQTAAVAFLLRVIEKLAAKHLARPDARWQLHIAGSLDLLPASTAHALRQAVEATRTCLTRAHLTLAIGYGGRQEIIDAMRDLPRDQAADGRTLDEMTDSLTAFREIDLGADPLGSRTQIS